MSPRNELAVWLDGQLIAHLRQVAGRSLRLQFTPEVVTKYGSGTPLLSLSLPLTNKRMQSDAVDNWFDALLPEGPVRSHLEVRHRLRPGDTFGLLAQIGRECAGAVQVLPVDDDQDPSGVLQPLTRDQFEQAIRELPAFNEELPVEYSVGGVQNKMLLTRTSQGWAHPSHGAISTHIVKPQPREDLGFPAQLVESEHLALQLATASGLDAAATELDWVDGRPVIIVKRFDRTNDTATATLRRVHQEDFSQALSIPSIQKYEQTDQGRLTTLAGLLRFADDPQEQRLRLLEQITFNMAIGNSDAHAKNYSLRLVSGRPSVAPLYDVAPLYFLNPRSRQTGFAVNHQNLFPYVGLNHVIEEGMGWGIPAAATRQRSMRVLECLRSAVDQVMVPNGLDECVSKVRERIQDQLDTTTQAR